MVAWGHGRSWSGGVLTKKATTGYGGVVDYQIAPHCDPRSGAKSGSPSDNFLVFAKPGAKRRVAAEPNGACRAAQKQCYQK